MNCLPIGGIGHIKIIVLISKLRRSSCCSSVLPNELMKALGEKVLEIEGLDKKESEVNLDRTGGNPKPIKCC